VRTNFGTGNGAKRDRRVGWAKRRGADFRDRHIQLLRHQRQANDIAGLALIRAHAERGVALEVLHRLITFARRQRNVVDGDVVLQIDKPLGTRAPGGNGP